jgi:hypothetical protein
MVITLIAQIVRFALPNIQIYDAQVVDLYQWVSARYLVGVKGAEATARRGLSTALGRISERITLVPRATVRRGRPDYALERELVFPFRQARLGCRRRMYRGHQAQ